MRNPKRTCQRCNKTKRPFDTATYDKYGVCVTCYDTIGINTYPAILPSPVLSTEISPVDLYWDTAVNRYAIRGYKGLLS